jgi:hypothetical protein
MTMRETHRTFLLFGGLFMASLAVVHCGGDDSSGGPTGASGSGPGTGTGSSGSAGSSATSTATGTGSGAGGTGSTTTGSAGAGGTSAGSGGAGGSNAGGTAGVGGATVGDSGIKDAPVIEASACPAMAPANDSACTTKQVCHYADSDCACTKAGGGTDAARSWSCSSVEAGVVIDAGPCPATLMDGDACTSQGQRCPTGDAGNLCVCLKDSWNCP